MNNLSLKEMYELWLYQYNIMQVIGKADSMTIFEEYVFWLNTQKINNLKEK